MTAFKSDSRYRLRDLDCSVDFTLVAIFVQEHKPIFQLNIPFFCTLTFRDVIPALFGMSVVHIFCPPERVVLLAPPQSQVFDKIAWVVGALSSIHGFGKYGVVELA